MNNSPEYFTIPLIPWDDLKTRQRLDLPKFEFKIDKIKYKATDLRLLNPLAIQAFNIIIENIKEYPIVPIIPFSKIDEIGAGMYKGEKIRIKERHVDEYCNNN